MRAVYLISVLLNAVLLVAVVVLWRSSHGTAPGPKPVAVESQGRARAAPAAPSSGAPIAPVEIGGDWHHWLGPLRQAGVPASVLAGLVQADFDRRWQTRQAALQERYMRGEIDADGLAAAGVEHDVELNRELAAALGPESYRAWDMQRVLEGMNVDRVQLSDSERNSVYDLERGLRDDLRQIESDKLSGAIDQGTFTQRQKDVQDAVTRKLRELLGENRAAQLQGSDDTIGTLKRAFPDDALTSSQLDQLAAVQRTWDRTRSRLVTEEVNTDDPAVEDQIVANENAYRAEFERIAGPSALDRYLKSQDSRYEALKRGASVWGLAPAQVDPVFDAIKTFEDTVQQYQRDAAERGVDPLTRQTAIFGFRRETEKALELRLGPTLFRDLMRNGVVPVAGVATTTDR